MEPLEVYFGTFAIYTAPVGEAFPLIDVAPAGNWKLLGKNGSRNYMEEGVSISHGQTAEEVRMYGTTHPVKTAISAESTVISATIADLTLEAYTFAINNVAVVDNAPGVGVAGFREIGLKRGLDPYVVAMLLRAGQSPYGLGFALQYELKRVSQIGSPEHVSVKNAPAGLSVQFTCLEALDGSGIGRIVSQDAAPLP